MKTLFAVFVVFGLAQFSLANSAVRELLPQRLELAALEIPVFGSMHGSYGLIGAFCFSLVVMFRLRRSGR